MTSRSSHALLVFAVLIGLMAWPAARGQQQAPNQPGTTWNERQPSVLPLVIAPLSSRYMLRDAFSGARSRKSMKVARPSAMRISM